MFLRVYFKHPFLWTDCSELSFHFVSVFCSQLWFLKGFYFFSISGHHLLTVWMGFAVFSLLSSIEMDERDLRKWTLFPPFPQTYPIFNSSCRDRGWGRGWENSWGVDKVYRSPSTFLSRHREGLASRRGQNCAWNITHALGDCLAILLSLLKGLPGWEWMGVFLYSSGDPLAVTAVCVTGETPLWWTLACPAWE